MSVQDPGSGAARSEAGLDERAVADYLRRHPDFFERHVGLLALLRVPHPCGGAVSLIERQVAVLREQNRHLSRKLTELVNTARDNERLSAEMHRLALGLMEAEGFGAVVARVREALAESFGAELAVMRLVRLPGEGGSVEDGFVGLLDMDEPDTAAAFEGFLKGRRPVCGRLRPEQVSLLYGERAGAVASGALVYLGEHSHYGVLAIGSRDRHRFHPAMGTVFLSQLGALVSRALRPYLGP